LTAWAAVFPYGPPSKDQIERYRAQQSAKKEAQAQLVAEAEAEAEAESEPEPEPEPSTAAAAADHDANDEMTMDDAARAATGEDAPLLGDAASGDSAAIPEGDPTEPKHNSWWCCLSSIEARVG
jgi:hypothetical protein